MTKTLIAFFSMSGESYVGGKLKNLEIGNTQVAANMIAQLINADLYHIQTAKPTIAQWLDKNQLK